MQKSALLQPIILQGIGSKPSQKVYGRIVKFKGSPVTEFDPEGNEILSSTIFLFSTPHGNKVKAGRWNFSSIDKEGLKKLHEFELHALKLRCLAYILPKLIK